jgi:ribosomal protein L31
MVVNLFFFKQIFSTNNNKIEVDISFYHPNDDETKKVYDEEGMLEEFQYKLKQIIKNN